MATQCGTLRDRGHQNTRTLKGFNRRQKPPADWTCPSETSFQRRFCDQLSEFIKTPSAEVGRIPAREDIRSHLIQQISRTRFDLTHTIEKLKTPYTLILTRTQDSFNRALKRYQLEKKLLASLPQPNEKPRGNSVELTRAMEGRGRRQNFLRPMLATLKHQ